MKSLLPTTIEGWCKKKRQFMRLWSKEPNPEQAEVYEQAINYCDRKTIQARKMYRRLFLMVILVNVLVLLSIFAQGCNTIEGARMDIHQWTDTPAHHK